MDKGTDEGVSGKDGGIVRWRDLERHMSRIEDKISSSEAAIEAKIQKLGDKQSKISTDVASIKTELRIMAAILMAALLTLITLVVNHIAG